MKSFYRVTASIIAVFMLLTSFSGCKKKQEIVPTEYPTIIEGVKILSAPLRVISLSPSLTEIVFDMGYGGRIVGRSDYCDYPSAVTKLPSCGNIYTPNLEQIKKLKPDYILVSASISRKNMEDIELLGAKAILIKPATSLNDLKELYIKLGKMFLGESTGKTKATTYFVSLKKTLDDLTTKLISQEKKSALIIANIDGNIATPDTLESQIIGFSNITNIATQGKNWSVEPALLAQYAPQIILISASITVEQLKAHPVYKNFEAVKQGKIYPVDLTALEKQGKRAIDVATTLATVLYPDIINPPTSSSTLSSSSQITSASSK